MMTSAETPVSDKFQILEKEKMDDKTSKFVVICVALCGLISVVALILAFVGVTQKGVNQYTISAGAGSNGATDAQTGLSRSEDRIWVFQIGHFGSNTQYLHEASGTIRGYDVDVVNAVCQLANKNCVLVWDLYERCWDSQAGERPRGGIGLMDGWYDGCIGWIQTIDRTRTYVFSNEIEKTFSPGFWVKTGGALPNYPSFTGLTVGFLDGWWIDEHCLNRYDNVLGFDVGSTAQVIHYQVEDDLIAALVSGEIDVAFLPDLPYLVQHTEVQLVVAPDTDKCALSGAAIMMPKNQFELLTWFNAAFARLVDTSQYRTICANLKEDHGGVPGADPADICVN